jgi:hypothetical protein
MNTNSATVPKRIYIQPEIERVQLDNEISLVLESGPPFPGNESSLMAPEYFNNDPYKTYID